MLKVVAFVVVVGLALACPARAAQPASKVSLPEQAYNRASITFDRCEHTKFRRNKKEAADQVVEDFRSDNVVVDTDASGFISWVLSEVSPPHLWAVAELERNREVPQAATFANFFGVLKSDKPYKGWLGVESFRELKRGDFIAWGEDKTKGSNSAGAHVMIVAAPPGLPKEATLDGKQIRYVSIAVIDSSPISHFPPEKLPPLAEQQRRDGLGQGCIRLLLDDQNKPIAHWDGTYSALTKKNIDEPSTSPVIAFGRMVPSKQLVPVPTVGLKMNGYLF